MALTNKKGTPTVNPKLVGKVAVDFPPAPKLFEEESKQLLFEEWYYQFRQSVLNKLESIVQIP